MQPHLNIAIDYNFSRWFSNIPWNIFWCATNVYFLTITSAVEDSHYFNESPFNIGNTWKLYILLSLLADYWRSCEWSLIAKSSQKKTFDSNHERFRSVFMELAHTSMIAVIFTYFVWIVHIDVLSVEIRLKLNIFFVDFRI